MAKKSDKQIEAKLESIKELIGKRRYRAALQEIVDLEREIPALDADGEPTDHYLRLMHSKGLALARLGHLEKALKIYDDLPRLKAADSEITGLGGRLYMDRYDQLGDPKDLETSWKTYHKGYRYWRFVNRQAAVRFEETDSPDDRKAWIKTTGKATYLGINSAAKQVLLGYDEEARSVAQEVQELAEKVPKRSRDYWLKATLGEAWLIQGDLEVAAEVYAEAVNNSPDVQGSHSTTWLQARRLMTAMQLDAAETDKIWGSFRHLVDAKPDPSVLTPANRRLRAYAFDPSLARSLETAVINEITLHVLWEIPAEEDPKSGYRQERLYPGPVGEYLEIVDYDPASGCFYEPVDLNDQRLLAQDGLAPSEGDPKFHQQMVYAVAMSVIAHFERALGRRALWAPRGEVKDRFVRRLRIYPHALREANAYYSPEKKALFFGYFPADTDDPSIVPGSRIFTCLSHDVIAHEMSHALLDGLHPQFAESTNQDVLALHEAFADVVALFQHFSHPEVLQHEIARTRGDLSLEGILGRLAHQFGRAIGRYGGLRDAIGEFDPETGSWQPKRPSPDELEKAHEPHVRGSVLVAAIFDAFLTIYEVRTRDLVRIASQGSGILRPGALHPDLVGRLANEAARTARHVLRMCIRALDYCPPVDVDFGDYLRALITADVDLVPEDRFNYRLAFIEAFQRRGIHPYDVLNLSVESLVWRPPRGEELDVSALFESDDGRPTLSPAWRPRQDRREIWTGMQSDIKAVECWLRRFCTPHAADEFGLVLSVDAPESVRRDTDGKRPRSPWFEVNSVRLARRSAPNGELQTDLVVEILQERDGYSSDEIQRRVDFGESQGKGGSEEPFVFRGGCTLLIDPGSFKVRYAITKHILSAGRLRRQRAFLRGRQPFSLTTYFADPQSDGTRREPFALLHGIDG